MAACVAVAGAQADKKPIDATAFESWRQVSVPQLSPNGDWATYELKPARGDGAIILYNVEAGRSDTVHRGTGAQLFGPDGGWVAVTIKPTFEQQRQAKIKKLKEDKAPQDSVEIFPLGRRSAGVRVPLARNLAVAERGNVVAYLRSVMPVKDTTTAKNDKDSTAAASKAFAKASAKPKKFNRLVLWDVVRGDSVIIDSVKSYKLSRGGESMIYELDGDSLCGVGVYANGRRTDLFRSKTGKVAALALDTRGSRGAYVATTDTVDHARYRLYYFDTKNPSVREVAHGGAANGYVVSPYGALEFSDEYSGDGHRLEFGMAPPLREIPKDTLPSDEKFSLDLWSWSDTLLMTQQLASVKRIKEQNYTAAYYPASDRWSLVADYDLSRVVFATDPAARYALGMDNNPYEWASTWESPTPTDLYAINLESMERRLLKRRVVTRPSLSPSSDYVIYYDPEVDGWISIESATGREANLTDSIPYSMHESNFDNPTFAPAEGIAGWAKLPDAAGRGRKKSAREGVIVYDNFDMWLLDPSGQQAPRSLTAGAGRRDSIVLRYRSTDPERPIIDLSEPMLLTAFDKASRNGGFYTLSPEGQLTRRVLDNHKYTFAKKARLGDRIVWQRENFNEYRDLWCSTAEFKNPTKISTANPQQGDYKWGSVEKVRWDDMNGEPTEGLLYLPEDYDSTRRYPVIVYFYERHTDDLHKHLHPQPSWSIVVPSVCTSRDYVVFMPDIRYHIGYPGQSCYDAVVSGSKMLIDRGIADPARIGLQGQSWGGYQIAYLVTRTNMFRCASPGAPVTNMTSAFGGIRWGSGMPRMFQYERGQSRIGGSLWEKPIEYIENSPLFFANKVRTPMLMRHDDADEAVPWYQGIEYFVALRRHGVPVWMLNYNGEPHNLKGWAAKMDWDCRMMQFFDYYLKDAPMPRWMRDGISVTEKGVDQKYDLLK